MRQIERVSNTILKILYYCMYDLLDFFVGREEEKRRILSSWIIRRGGIEIGLFFWMRG